MSSFGDKSDAPKANAVKQEEEDDGVSLPPPPSKPPAQPPQLQSSQPLPPQQTKDEKQPPPPPQHEDRQQPPQQPPPPPQHDHTIPHPTHDAAVAPPHPPNTHPSTQQPPQQPPHASVQPPQAPPSDHHRPWSETIFPMKLYDILCNPEFSHAIAWLPHGRSWKVLNKEYFMEEICPIYFAQTRYESFIRQVNGWGFKRLRREGPDRSSYYHEHFLRGYPNLIDHMRRPAPGEKTRDMREEPDLYAVAPMPQLPPRIGMSSNVAMRKNAKVGRPAMGPRSFDSMGPPRGPEYPHQQSSYGPPPYNMGPPWAGYYSYAPPPPPSGYYPPSPWRGAPPPPNYYGGWGPPPNQGPPPGYPYPPPPPYDNYYGYPPPSPQHRPRDDSYQPTPKRHRDSDAEDEQRTPKRPPPIASPMGGVMEHHHPPTPHGYYHHIYGELTPKENMFDGPAVPGEGIEEQDVNNL